MPAEVVVTNHVMGLYELAAIHLSSDEPDLAQAALAIDALGCLVDGLGGFAGSIAAAKAAAGLQPDDSIALTEYPAPRTPLERLLSLMADEGESLSVAIVDALGLRRYFADAVEARVGPLVRDLDLLRPPVGRLQMPPMRIQH